MEALTLKSRLQGGRLAWLSHFVPILSERDNPYLKQLAPLSAFSLIIHRCVIRCLSQRKSLFLELKFYDFEALVSSFRVLRNLRISWFNF